MDQFSGIIFSTLILVTQSYTAIASSLEASTPCNGTSSFPCIVQETLSAYTPVNHLRASPMITAYFPGNIAGIDALKFSASAEPNENGWQEISTFISQQNEGGLKQVVVIDLRQESHGYLNGIPINLMNYYNWINIDKTNEQVRIDERSWLENLASQPIVTDVLTSQQFEKYDFLNGIAIETLSVHSEEEAVTRAGLNYFRLYVSDHRAPGDREIDRFVAFYRHLPKNTWLHFHCRGGKGRSTSFLAMLDMLNNADKVSFEDIIARQASIPPFYNLLEVNRIDPELTPYYQQRLVFLREFYQYAREYLAGYTGSWSDWKRALIL